MTKLWERLVGAWGVLIGRYAWYEVPDDVEAAWDDGPEWSLDNPPPGYMDDELRAAYEEGVRDGGYRWG